MRRQIDTLSDREQEVLALIRMGLTNEEIARRLGISLDGAKYHVSQILSKLGVGSREEAIAVVGEGRRRRWLAAPLWAKIAGAATVVAAAGGLAVFASGVLRTEKEVEDAATSEEPIRDQREVIDTGSPALPRVTLQPSRFGSASYSPDGSWVLAFADDGILIYSVDGNESRNLEAKVGLNIFAARWMPDSRTVVAAVSPDRYIKSEFDLVSLYLIAIDGSSTKKLATTDSGHIFEILPDGRVAYVLEGSLYLYDPDDEASVNTGVPVERAPANNAPFRLSVDGRFVATLSGSSMAAIKVTDLMSGETVTIETGLKYRGVPYAWSRSGGVLAYGRRDDRRSPEVVLYDASAAEKSVVWNDDQFGFYEDFAWTPDGEWLVFSHNGGGTGYFDQEYQALNLTTGEHVALFTGGGGLNLSPDGTKMGIFRNPPNQGYWLATLEWAPSR